MPAGHELRLMYHRTPLPEDVALYAKQFSGCQSLGSDGARFLDCDLSRDPASAAIDIGRVLESLFEVRTTTKLRFVGEMLPPLGDSESV